MDIMTPFAIVTGRGFTVVVFAKLRFEIQVFGIPDVHPQVDATMGEPALFSVPATASFHPLVAELHFVWQLVYGSSPPRGCLTGVHSCYENICTWLVR